VTEVSLRYFDVLGASAILGRSFLPEDHTASAPPVALLSADFWAAEFHRDPAVLGKTIQMNGATFTVTINVIVKAVGNISNTGTVSFDGIEAKPGNESFTIKIAGQ